MKTFSLPNEVALHSIEREKLFNAVQQLLDGALAATLGNVGWTVTRAEFIEPDKFADEMRFFFARQHPFEFKQLCECLIGHVEIGVFQFQLERTDDVPKEFVGRSVLVLTDVVNGSPIWEFTSLLSS